MHKCANKIFARNIKVQKLLLFLTRTDEIAILSNGVRKKPLWKKPAREESGSGIGLGLESGGLFFRGDFFLQSQTPQYPHFDPICVILLAKSFTSRSL